MTRVIRLSVFVVLVLGSAISSAQSDQFYFTARVGPLAALGGDPGTGSAVFLRWDVIEADLPTNIDELALFRNDDPDPIWTGSARTQPRAAELAAYYAEPGQARRRAEMLRDLQALAAAPLPGQRGPGIPDAVDGGNFASVLASRLALDPLWRLLVSRRDINVARALNRAYIDTDLEGLGSTVRYELIGRSGGNQVLRLGLLELDPSASLPLLAPADFRQVLTARCDAPESALDHGSVALTWRQGGNALEQFGGSINAVGFDLYRSIVNVDPASGIPDRDLAAEAAVAGFDALGNFQIAGLERVNIRPITISGQGTGVGFVQHRETMRDLLARNVRPGDTRDYYIVARDFAGHYGHTAKARVTVPDLLKPPAPWNVELLQSTPDQAMELRWDAVNVANYLHRFGAERTVCNADEARATGRLQFVGSGETCGVEDAIEVNLRVAGYRVYRFDSFDQAASFSDSDGDGYSDADERHVVRACDKPGNPETTIDCRANPGFIRTDPGSACNAAQAPNGRAQNFLVQAANPPAAGAVGARQVFRFADAGPAAVPGKVFWYRLASFTSVDANGQPQNVSPLSPPLRARFDNYRLPERSVLGGLISVDLTAPECSDLDTRVVSSSGGQVANDVSGTGREIYLACSPEGGITNPTGANTAVNLSGSLNEALLQLGGAVLRAPIQEIDGGLRGAVLNKAQCAELKRQCADRARRSNSEFVALFSDGLGGNLGGARVPAADFGSCRFDQQAELFTTGLKDRCAVPSSEEQSGITVTAPLQVKVAPLPANHCVSVYRTINGERQRLETLCDGDPEIPGNLDPAVIGPVMGYGETVCLSTTLHDTNNRVSVSENLPCVHVLAESPKRPAPPQPLGLSFAGTKLEIQWRTPEQRISAAQVQIFQGADTQTAPVIVETVGLADGGLAGNPDSNGRQGPSATPRSLTLDLAGLEFGEYCARLRVVGVGAWKGEQTTLSDFSPLLCGEHRPGDSPPSRYLPWPEIHVPEPAEALVARFASEVLAPVVEVTVVQPSQAPANCQDVFEVAINRQGGRLSNQSDAGPQILNLTSISQVEEACASSASGSCTYSVRRICQNVDSARASGNVCTQYQRALADDFDFVVYRQSRAIGASVNTDFYQVSPLVDRLFCETEVDSEKALASSRLADPYIQPLKVGALADDGYRMVFVDRYPVSAEREYRYQLVYFDATGEISRTRTSQWLALQ